MLMQGSIVKKAVQYLFLIASSFGFTFLLLGSRALEESKSLNIVIDYQSKAVFFSFIFQAGLRAAVRNLVHTRRGSVARHSVKFATTFLTAIAIIYITLIFFKEFHLYLTSAAVVAVSTIKLTLAIAESNSKRIYAASVLVFLSSLLPGLALLLSNNDELLSQTISLFLLLIYLVLTKFSPTNRFKAVIPVIKYGSGMQLGSLFIYLLVFLIAQVSIELSNNKEIYAFIYADAQIVSGLIVLLISKALLLAEEKLFRERKIKVAYRFIASFTLFASITFFAFITLLYGWLEALFGFAVISCLIGRLPIGFLVQYLQKQFFLLLLLGLLILVAAYVSIYMTINDAFHATVLLAGFNLSLLTSIYLLISSRKDIFIDRHERNENKK